MINRFFLCFLPLFILFNSANAQSVYGYDVKSNSDNVGLTAGLSLNNTSQLIKTQFGGSTTAKGANSLIPTLGIYYQKSIGSRLLARVGFSFGYSTNAYKYASKYDSLTPEYYLAVTKNATYEKVTHGTYFVLPQIDFGYVFGPIKDMYLIEVRAGAALQAYLGKSNDSVTEADGKFYDKKKDYTAVYSQLEGVRYGRPKSYGSFLTNIYVGMKWQKTTNEFLNHFAIGLQATLPISTSDAGYSDLQYRGDQGTNYARQQVYFSQFSFGLKASYNLL